jgi:myo-inositol-1(or 4)-monophosphatase
MTATAADLEHAVAALRAAGDVLRRHAASAIPFELKNGCSPVTAADHEVDALLRGWLPRPGEAWLSEESDDDPVRLEHGRVWVVDPLDGTRAFVARRPEYSTSIALLEDGVPVLGAVGNPASGVLVSGGLGLGVRCEGAPQLDWPGPGDGLTVLASRSERKRGEWARHEQRGLRVLPMGSVAYSLALVAAGLADATWTLHPKHEWDVAAGAALVWAAGGEVWLPHGGEMRWNHRTPKFASFAACGPGLRDRVRSAMAGA